MIGFHRDFLVLKGIDLLNNLLKTINNGGQLLDTFLHETGDRVVDDRLLIFHVIMMSLFHTAIAVKRIILGAILFNNFVVVIVAKNLRE
jgi:hypothetical protein